MKKLLSIILTAAVLASAAITTLPINAAKSDPEAADGVETVFTIGYSDKNNGIVNHKNTAVLTKGDTSQGEKALKVVPTPDIADDKAVYLDCFSISYSSAELSKVRFVTVRYKYDVPEGVKSTDKMTFFIMRNGGAVKSTVSSTASPLVTGEWATAVFDFTSLAGAVTVGEDKLFKQFHIAPFGDTPAESLDPHETMYISDISFLTGNPDPDAVYSVDFYCSNPDVEGDGPESLSVKRGEEYTLPEAGYTLKNAVFAGWKSLSDGKLYAPGTKIIGGEGDTGYTAEFTELSTAAVGKGLDFTEYFNGIVDRKNSAVTELLLFDGRKAVKVIPNADYETDNYNVYLDGWTYHSAKIDITKYKYMAVCYYVDTPTLPKETGMQINFMRNGGVLTSTFNAPQTNSLVCGKWDYAITDISGITEKISPTAPDMFIRQIHITPFGSYKMSDFTGDEVIYISALLFFAEKPELAEHEAYMKGYSDGTFRPQGNMTRAEACTIIARLAAGGDALVPTDKATAFSDVASTDWYHKYISYVESLGYLKSYIGAFLPDKAITRAEFVELVYNMGLLHDAGKNGTFTDVAADHPRASVISAAGKAGLVNGYDNGNGTFSFKPDATITRAEVVKVVNNAYGRSITADCISSDVSYCFLDVEPDFWAYADICEAALTHLTDGKAWIYSVTDPASLVANARPDFEKGIEYLATLDKISEERKQAILGTRTDIIVEGTSYYVDAEDGNDSNDGKSPETAWKTVSKVNAAPLRIGDAVFFKRGDIYRTRMTAKAGVTYSAYGIGEKPRFYGSPENGAEPSKWTLMPGTENIWIYATEMVDVGTIVLDEKVAALKEIPDLKGGQHYVRKTDKVFDIKTELDENLEFYCEIKSKNMGSDTGKIYLRCDEGNPGEIYKSIEFNTKNNVISVGGNGITFDNLCVMYGGSHGIGSGTVKDLTVKNCTIGWIGGSIQHYNDDGTVTRFGNGIEIYGGCDGYTVDNCYIYQCYDAGVTHQYSARSGGGVNISMYNITYSNNLIEDCIYSVEYFNDTSPSPSDIRDGKNFRIVGNIMRRAGYGFGNQRSAHASSHLKGWDTRNEYKKGTYVIENNIFDRGMWSLVQTQADYDSWCPVYNNNVYIQWNGGPIGYNKGAKRLVFDSFASLTVTTELGDRNAKVYWLPEEYKHDGFLTR